MNRACAQDFSDWITSPETQDEIGSFGARLVRGAALRPRRAGLMDAVHEVLGRSVLVSLSAPAIALALGVPRRDLARARASPGSRRARDRGQHWHGRANRRGRAGRRPAAVAKRSARQSGADLHPARDDHRAGPDRGPADRRDHDGRASGAAAGAARPAPDARGEHSSARRPALDRGARADPRRRHGRLRARDLGGRLGDPSSAATSTARRRS